MKKTPPKNNFAFIDAQNLYLGIRELGWKLDYKKFFVYLKEKYHVSKAYMFMGFIPTNQELYSFLQECGFVIVFKPILEVNNRVKGNCDAELVLQTMADIEKYRQAIIITGDGDFYCLVKYLREREKLLQVIAPSKRHCSQLLYKSAKHKISHLSELEHRLCYNKSTPSGRNRKRNL